MHTYLVILLSNIINKNYSCNICDSRRYKDSLGHNRGQGMVESVDFVRWTCSKETADGAHRLNSDGHPSPRFTRYNPHQLPAESQNDYKAVPCQIIRTIRHRMEKTRFYLKIFLFSFCWLSTRTDIEFCSTK